MNVHYTLSVLDPAQHLLEVLIDVSDVEAESLDFMFPAWTPGSYLLREYSRHIQHVEVYGRRSVVAMPAPGEQPQQMFADQPITTVHKIDKHTWRVMTDGANWISLSYRVYGNDLTVRTNHVDDTHAHVIPAATFMYIKDAAQQPLHVTVLQLPDGWNVATGLDPVDPATQLVHLPTLEQANVETFVADDYDHLVDSPFELGLHRVLTFEVDHKPHRIVIWGQGNEDQQRLLDDTRKIVQVQRDFWGELPYAHYTFFVMLAGSKAGGGLEHRNSTSLLLSRFVFQPARSYERYLSLVSHEFFHVWNVKRLRAQGLGPFDYTQEAYTTLLWAMEGITEYYTDLLLLRAGLLTSQRYLERLADDIVTLQTTPGRTVQSLECASFDAWIKFYRSDENSINTSVSYYLKGALVAALLDLDIRRRTSGEHSLDDVMRHLYRTYPADGPGIPDRHAYVAAIKDVTGHDLSDFFDNYIARTTELPFDEILAAAGLQLHWSWKDTANGEPRPTLGVRFKRSNGHLLVTNVLSDGPAYAAGLNADDEIVALNGYRVTSEADLRERLDERRAGDTVTLTIFRREEQRSLDVQLAAPPHDKLGLKHLPDVSEEQRRLRAGWVGT